MIDKLDDNFVVAIDGPAGSGKSTLAKLVAKKIDGIVIDTGAMYRSVTYLALKEGVDPEDEKRVAKIASLIDIRFEPGENNGQKVIVNNEDVTTAIRSHEVNTAVSIVSAYADVRNRLVTIQRSMGKHGRVVMEGRDIGSNVFPDAKYKFFLVADDHERATRRLKEANEPGQQKLSYDDVIKNIRSRDRIDSSRKNAPLIMPPNAHKIDTSSMAIDEVLQEMLNLLFS